MTGTFRTIVFIGISCSSFLILSCNSGSEKLKIENDSLRLQLKVSSKMVETMKTVRVLLDSIDAARHTYHSDLPIDTTGGYASRMTDLKEYVKKTEDKIKELEAAMVEEDVNNQSYMMLIDALKSELKLRNEEIGIIQDNEEMKVELDSKNTELSEVESKLDTKKEELKLYEMRIKEMVRTMKISEADSYYAQAGALEEAAKRTKLAPNKRRDTYAEALELYQKSLKLGKKEAKAKVNELKGKLN